MSLLSEMHPAIRLPLTGLMVITVFILVVAVVIGVGWLGLYLLYKLFTWLGFVNTAYLLALPVVYFIFKWLGELYERH